MKLIYTSVLTLVSLLTLLFSCGDGKRKPDLSGIDLSVKIERFDQELAALDSSEVLQKNSEWQERYQAFYPDFMRYMLMAGDPQDTAYVNYTLNVIVGQKDFKALAAAVQKKYPSLAKQEKELTEAFKYLKYYFPAYELPRVISFFSGFKMQVPVGEDYVGIGLDMFLGADSEFYPALIGDIPMYLSRRFTPENIRPRVVESILRQELIPTDDKNTNMLQHMVYEGKVLLALDSLLPDVADSIKIGYTQDQQAWVEKYQPEVWAWILEEDLLYNTDHNRIQKYFTEAPFTAELGENNESAPKLGAYLGWMLVRRYMDRHPALTLQQLINKDDAQEILTQSKFKGR